MLLNKHNFNVVEFASTEASRFTLKAIEVSAEGTIATNGHYMVRVDPPKMLDANFPAVEGFKQTNTPPKFLLDSDAAKKISKAIPKTSIPVLSNACVGEPDANSQNIAVTDLDVAQVFKVRSVEGKFPEWKQILHPNGEPSLTIGVNAAYLAKLAKAAADFSDNRNTYLSMKFYGPGQAIILRAENRETGQVWEAALMPVAE